VPASNSIAEHPMAAQNKPEPQASFSVDEFIGEIEKAEAERLNKRLPQERLRNKRQLDNAARRAA
jgi:excinuclease ABC subunit B